MDCDEHLTGFASAFVIASKRERWLELLSRRGKNTFRNSAKLMDALDSRYCLRVDGKWELDANSLGVFYDFFSEPSVTTLTQATAVGHDQDAIFSIVPGKLAIHFSHEGWSWLCRR